MNRSIVPGAAGPARMETHQIDRSDSRYAAVLTERLGPAAPAGVAAMGRVEILRHHRLGLICSIRCPGSVVIKTFDAIRELRDAGIVVAGGFHSPMEKECLDFLLRGEQPVIVCPAKGLACLRMPPSWREAIDAGRLLLLSPFDNDVKRTTNAQAQTRNQFIAALSHAVLIPHASPGGKAEPIARCIVERRQPLFTFDDSENSDLLHHGARSYDLDALQTCIAAPR